MPRVRKHQIIATVIGRSPVHKRKVHKIVQDALDIIVEELSRGNDVFLKDFGHFRVVDLPPRRGFNPRTRLETDLAARRVVRFRPSKLMREAVG